MSLATLLESNRIIPVVTIEDPEHAVPLAQAFKDGGIQIIEITLRTNAALAAIENILTDIPEMIVAAGTVLTEKQLQQVAKLGVHFAVSPGFTDHLAAACRKITHPFLPGASTISDVMRLKNNGFEIIKFFPAEIAGSIAMLKQWYALFPSIKVCPTGGINADNYKDYLALPNVTAIGGSWLAPKNLIADQRWDEISELCLRAISL